MNKILIKPIAIILCATTLCFTTIPAYAGDLKNSENQPAARSDYYNSR